MRNPLHILLSGWIVIIIVLTWLAVSMSSCSVFQKNKSSHKENLDSTTVKSERVDSVAKSDSVGVHKSLTQDSGSIVIDFDTVSGGHGDIYLPVHDTMFQDRGIYVFPTSPDDYLEITKEGTVRTNKPIKRVTITGVHLNNTSDSSGKRNDVSLSKNKVDSTHKKQEVKDVVKNKKSFRPSFLLTISAICFLLLLLMYLYYRWQKRKFTIPHI
jgi:hypothetical protein